VSQPEIASAQCGSCLSNQCCQGTTCVTIDAPDRCIAADGTCAVGGTAGCPCCDGESKCVPLTTCIAAGGCCQNGLCFTRSAPSRCAAPDGSCAAGGTENCTCCDGESLCVAACGADGCCQGGLCLTK